MRCVSWRRGRFLGDMTGCCRMVSLSLLDQVGRGGGGSVRQCYQTRFQTWRAVLMDVPRCRRTAYSEESRWKGGSIERAGRYQGKIFLIPIGSPADRPRQTPRRDCPWLGVLMFYLYIHQVHLAASAQMRTTRGTMTCVSRRSCHTTPPPHNPLPQHIDATHILYIQYPSGLEEPCPFVNDSTVSAVQPREEMPTPQLQADGGALGESKQLHEMTRITRAASVWWRSRRALALRAVRGVVSAWSCMTRCCQVINSGDPIVGACAESSKATNEKRG